MADKFNVIGGVGEADDELDQFTKGIGFPLVDVNDQAGSLTFGDITVDSIKLDPTATEPTVPVQGEMWWNADEESANLKLNEAVLQLGLETLYHVQNNTGLEIKDGTPVMFDQAVGNSGRGRVALMDGSVTENASLFLGLATETLPDDTTGKITHFGRVRGIDCTGGAGCYLSFAVEAWAEGDTLYIDPVNVGYLTKVIPSSPLLALPVCFVLNNTLNGTLFVRSTEHDEQDAWGDRDNGNYTEVQSDGSVALYGDATTWTDITGPLIGRRLDSAVGSVSYNWAENTVTMEPNGVITDTADVIAISVQKPHECKVSSSFLKMHIHWRQPDATQRDITFRYRTQENGSTTETAWTTVTVDITTAGVFPYTAGSLNQISPIVSIDWSDIAISSIVEMQFTRSDANAGNIEAMFVDGHFEIDSFGSRQEYIK